MVHRNPGIKPTCLHNARSPGRQRRGGPPRARAWAGPNPSLQSPGTAEQTPRAKQKQVLRIKISGRRARTASGTERLLKLESAQACIITSEISGAEVNNYILLPNTKTLAAKAWVRRLCRSLCGAASGGGAAEGGAKPRATAAACRSRCSCQRAKDEKATRQQSKREAKATPRPAFSSGATPFSAWHPLRALPAKAG